MANILRSIDRAIHKVLLFIANVSLVAMVLILFYTVMLRYVFNTGVGWAEEVPRLLVTVFVFLACAMGVRDHAHMTVNIVYNRFPKDGKARKTFEMIGDIAVLLCGLFLMIIGGQRVITMFSLSGTLPMTGLPNWVQYISVPIGGLVIVYDSLLFIFGVLKHDDTIYADQDIDYQDELLEQQRLHHEEEKAL